jgi:hypothetical protein
MTGSGSTSAPQVGAVLHVCVLFALASLARREREARLQVIVIVTIVIRVCCIV